MELLTKSPPKSLKYGIIRTERGRGYAVKISHGNNRGSGASGTFSAEIGSSGGLIVCV
jgi:hypothetical protein